MFKNIRTANISVDFFTKLFFVKIFFREILLKSQHAQSHAKRCRTNGICMVWEPGIAEMRKSANFPIFAPKVHFGVKCRKCSIFMFFTQKPTFGVKCTFAQKVQTWRPRVSFAYRTNAICRFFDPGVARMRKSDHFMHFLQKCIFSLKS